MNRVFVAPLQAIRRLRLRGDITLDKVLIRFQMEHYYFWAFTNSAFRFRSRLYRFQHCLTLVRFYRKGESRRKFAVSSCNSLTQKPCLMHFCVIPSRQFCSTCTAVHVVFVDVPKGKAEVICYKRSYMLLFCIPQTGQFTGSSILKSLVSLGGDSNHEPIRYGNSVFC